MNSPPPQPTDRMAALFEATEPLLRALRLVVATRAGRHPDALIPPTTLAEAQAILRTARQVLAHDLLVPGLLELRTQCSWAALETKLALTAAAFMRFRDEYRSWFPEVEGYLWLTREWSEIQSQMRRLPMDENGLDDALEESSADLSM